MFLVVTIFEVFQNFFAWLFPAAVLIEYAEFLELLCFFLTLLFCWGFILMPLWRIGTFFFKKRNH